MKKEFLDHIDDILTAMSDAVDFTHGMSQKEFIHDRRTVYAVIRTLEIIGEAAKSIPDDIRDKYNSIPWRQLVGMRNKLIHHYSGINYGLIWDTVEVDIPNLKPQFERIKQDYS